MSVWCETVLVMIGLTGLMGFYLSVLAMVAL